MHYKVSYALWEYGSKEEEEEHICKLSFSGECDLNLYLVWEAKVEHIFNVYEVEEDQKLKLASLECNGGIKL